MASAEQVAEAIIDTTQSLGGLDEAALVATGQAPDRNIALVAMCAALTFAAITEGISWFLVYSKEDYKRQVSEVVELQGRVESMQEKMMYSIGSQSMNQ